MWLSGRPSIATNLAKITDYQFTKSYTHSINSTSMKSLSLFSPKLILLILLVFSQWEALAQKSPKKPAEMAYYCSPCNNDCDFERHDKAGTCKHCHMALVERRIATVDSLLAAKKKQKASQPKKRNVAIFIHDGVEILDFAGPSEVFASTEGFNVYTVSLTKKSITSQGFITVTPNYTLKNCPQPDIVVLPGGQTGPFLTNEPLINWITASAKNAEIMLSVCTGAGLLGKAGLLNGKQATTFHDYIDALQEANPQAKVLRETRFVDNGQIITTAGVSAGIDGALHVVAKLKGIEVARQTARYMEYDKWKPNEGLIAEQVGQK
jgi:putative intracellular protease/amidase